MCVSIVALPGGAQAQRFLMTPWVFPTRSPPNINMGAHSANLPARVSVSLSTPLLASVASIASLPFAICVFPVFLKGEFIRSNPNVCATIIEDRGYIMDECAHEFRSVVVWGKRCFVETQKEKKHAMDVLLRHLEDDPDKIKRESLSNEAVYQNLAMLRLDVTDINGKWGR